MKNATDTCISIQVPVPRDIVWLERIKKKSGNVLACTLTLSLFFYAAREAHVREPPARYRALSLSLISLLHQGMRGVRDPRLPGPHVLWGFEGV